MNEFQVQIDPYLEDAMCSMCQTNPGPYFCREQMCFRYFCKSCWQVSVTFSDDLSADLMVKVHLGSA